MNLGDNSRYLPYSEKYKLFSDPQKASDWAVQCGFKSMIVGDSLVSLKLE